MTWTVVLHFGAGWRAVRGDAETDEDVTCYTGTFESAYEDGVETFGEDQFQPKFPDHITIRGGCYVEGLNVGEIASLERALMIRVEGPARILTALGRANL